MQWSSAAEFFAMGGSGLYVWGAYGVTAARIGAEVVALLRRDKPLRVRGSPHADPSANP
jgi:heme exporter protein D